MRTTFDDLAPSAEKRHFGFWFLPDRWSVLALVLALSVSLPVLVVFAALFCSLMRDVWRHLASTVLPGYIGHTLALAGGVGDRR